MRYPRRGSGQAVRAACGLLWALALCMIPPVARATTSMALDVSSLTRGSEWVIHGRVVHATSRWLPGTGRIVTDVELEVDEALKGTVAHGRVHVVRPGGTVGDVRQHVSGAPELEPGEEVVLFLARGATEGLRVVGMAQGKFRVLRSEEGRAVGVTGDLPEELRLLDPLSLQPVSGEARTMDLQTLRAQVRAALDSQTSPPPYLRTYAPAPNGATEEPCLWWPGGSTLTFRQQQCMPGEPDCEARREAVGRALRSWNDVLSECASLRLVEGPATSTRQVGYLPQSTSNENIIVLRSRSCSPQTGSGSEEVDCWAHAVETVAVTTLTFHPRTGKVLDADIELQAAAFASDESLDVQGTLTHELGHALGLAHSPDPRSTMYPTSHPDPLSQRNLDEGSRQAMCDIYPRGAPAMACVADPEPTSQERSPWGCSAATGGRSGSVLFGLASLLALRLRSRRLRGG